jgi:hypothetical protein
VRAAAAGTSEMLFGTTRALAAVYSFVRSSCLTSAARRRGNRAVCLFLRFELLDECGEMPRHRTREGVVPVLEALPDC